jgi:hypothetical protein
MNRKIVPVAMAAALSVSIAGLDLVQAGSPASAVTNQTTTRPLVRQDNYPNMPGTNFRAARPEEYPRIFGCVPWRLGGTAFECEDFFFPRRWRNPVDRRDRSDHRR